MALYDSHGIRFRYPEDWELTESEEAGDGELAVHVQSPGTAFWSLTLQPAGPSEADLFEATAAALRDEYGDVDVVPTGAAADIAGCPASGCTIEFVCHELPVIAEAVVFETPLGDRPRVGLVLCQYAELESEAVETLLERMTASIQLAPTHVVG